MSLLAIARPTQKNQDRVDIIRIVRNIVKTLLHHDMIDGHLSFMFFKKLVAQYLTAKYTYNLYYN